MKHHSLTLGLVFLSLLTAAWAAPAVADDRQPIVVELFTSQGCSSCPPANAKLIRISGRKDILALSFSVTYWDYLGWKDTYGRAEFTQRQVAYEPALHQPGPYTPQMVVNGTATAVGNNLVELESLLGSVPLLHGPDLSLNPGAVEIASGSQTVSADVWLVRYDPRLQTVPVARGENSGAALQHIHVVRRLERLGTWDGHQAHFLLPAPDAGLKTAVLVQQQNGGHILSAITD